MAIEQAVTAATIIETRGLRRTFKSGKREVIAVAGVDLAIRAGEIFGLLGPNGAGKTTLLRMLSTLLPLSSGEATVAGCDLRRQPGRVRHHVGLVGQLSGSDPAVSGRAELVLQGMLYDLGGTRARQRARELLELLELEECADRPTGTYSGGQRRRLDIALGLVHRPPVLFLDEPTTGLDPKVRARLWDEARRLREDGTTILLTTHYMDEADMLCDRVAIIDHGVIVAEGTPEQLKRETGGDVVTLGVSGDRDVALGLLAKQPFARESSVDQGTETVRLVVDDGERALPAILRLLEGAGIEMRSILLGRPSLDDVFLRKTGRSLREPEEANRT